MNLQKFYMGESFDACEYFGAHLEDGGVVFCTYAPNAHGITVVGDNGVFPIHPKDTKKNRAALYMDQTVAERVP